MRISPRFAVMLFAMLLSIVFIILDVLSVTNALKSALPVGINPFWKLSFVFKCLTDAVILDDFKTALDKIRHFSITGPSGDCNNGLHLQRLQPEHQNNIHVQISSPIMSPRGDDSRSGRLSEAKGSWVQSE